MYKNMGNCHTTRFYYIKNKIFNSYTSFLVCLRLSFLNTFTPFNFDLTELLDLMFLPTHHPSGYAWLELVLGFKIIQYLVSIHKSETKVYTYISIVLVSLYILLILEPSFPHYVYFICADQIMAWIF